MVAGEWIFNFIYLEDEFGNGKYYHDFEELNFYVISNSSDASAPTIKNLNLVQNGETLRTEDRLKISLEIEDDSTISRIQVNFKHNLSGVQKAVISDSKTQKSGVKNYEFEIPKNMAAGEWIFNFIYLEDEFGNGKYYDNFEELNFYVNYKEEPVVPETSTTINVGQSDKIQLNGNASGSWVVDNPEIVSIDNYGIGSGVGGGGSYFGPFVEFTGIKAGNTILKFVGISGRMLFSENIIVVHVPVITTETEEKEHTFTNFETEYIEDSNLEKGKEEVRVEGQKGYSVTTYIYTYEDGLLVNTEENTVFFEPVNEVIARGTYVEPVITIETKIEEHTFTDFNTEYVEDADLEKGKVEVKVEGQKGYSVTTYTYTYEDGLLVNTEENTVVFEPINEVIARGTYGKTQSGWIKQNEKWMYYDAEGVVQTGWTQVEKTWYHMNSDGHMQTGWIQVSGTWYYTNDSGAMQTGWTQVSGIWYYMNNSGAMQTGWTQVGSTWYYMNNSGAMQTGWTQVGSTWYYMNNSGAMQTGWVKLGNSWYYLNNNGSMQNRDTTINGKFYKFSSSGKML